MLDYIYLFTGIRSFSVVLEFDPIQVTNKICRAILGEKQLKLAVHQPNFLPWIGYFAKMKAVDTFVILDDVQMPIGRSYVSRVKLINGGEPRWLSIPCKSNPGAQIKSIEFADEKWPRKHLNGFQINYGKTPFFGEIMDLIRTVYDAPGTNLASFNTRLITTVKEFLGISGQVLFSSDFSVTKTGDERIIELCKQIGSSHYISGTGGMNYQSPEKFERHGIQLEVLKFHAIKYENYRKRFFPGLSILDPLFCLGKGARDILTYAIHDKQEGS